MTTLSVTRTARLKEKIQPFQGVLLIFLLSQVLFFLPALVSSLFLPQNLQEPARVEVKNWLGLGMYWRWDAVHYYTVANDGYTAFADPDGRSGLMAFFPTVPLVIRVVWLALQGFTTPGHFPISAAEPAPIIAGVLVALATCALAYFMFYRLAQAETKDDRLALRAVLYMAVFPMALYFVVPYTEALYTATSVGMFLAARKGQWVRAGLWAAVASATRPVGFLLAPALAIEMAVAWRRGGFRTRQDLLRGLSGLALAPLGLALYMLYLWAVSGDPLAFVNVHSTFYHGREFPLKTLARGVYYALTPWRSSSPDMYLRGLLHSLITVGFIAVIIVSARRWPLSYTVYGVLLLLFIMTAPLPGERAMHGFGRYLMVFFPVYLTLARWGRRRSVHRAILLVSIPLLVFFTFMYVCWYPLA